MLRSAITIFGRPGCHLCELAVAELEPLCRAVGLSLRVLDVDADPALRDRYGPRIPVVCAGEEELSGWPLNRARVASWLLAHAAKCPHGASRAGIAAGLVTRSPE